MKIIALDAGGTSAKFALYNLEGKVLFSQKYHTPHIMEVSTDRLSEIVANGVRDCLKACSTKSLAKENADYLQEDFVLSIGMAAYGRDKVLKEAIKQTLSAKYKQLILHGDMEIAYKAAFPDARGILLIAGTGSIAYAEANLAVYRTGGFGYFLGDEGSAYWIAKQALQTFTKELDGRLKKSELYTFVKQALNLQDDYAVISKSFKMTRSELANLCVSLIALYPIDENVKAIYDAAISELALLVKALEAKMPRKASRSIKENPLSIALVGGVFSSDILLANLQSKLGQDYLVERAKHQPIYGAYLYAKEYLDTQLKSPACQ